MNDASKSIFTSVTFWGIVLGFVSQLATRAGYHFPADTTGLANDMAGIAGAIMALVGRLIATQPVHIVAPVGSGNQSGFIQVRMLAVLLAASLAFACSTVPQTPAQSVYAVQGSYASALSVAVAYKQLPSCSQAPRPVLCSDAAIVAKIQAADDCAFAVLSVAQNLVRGSSTQPVSPGACPDPAISAAIQAAGTSVPALISVASQAVNVFGSLTSTLKLK